MQHLALNISEEDLKKKIKELGPWRHDIDLGNGIRTMENNLPGYQPEIRWKGVAFLLFVNEFARTSRNKWRIKPFT